MTDWTGGVATERATAVLANNPSMMTLEGTNTWILREPGAERSIVIDPGPFLEDHVQAVLAAAGPVGLTIVTHWHGDHTEASARFAELSGSVVRAFDPDYCIDAEPLVDGEQINVDGLDITIVTTPGHTQDSISIYVPADRALLTGDTVLGHGTTVIAHPDGTLAPFLDSMGKMRDLIDAEGIEHLLPAHGPTLGDPGVVIDYYLAHRMERLAQVKAAAEGGASTARAVVEIVYADVDPILWDAAERSVQAQLDYLGDLNP